jgi:hypothetical protein
MRIASRTLTGKKTPHAATAVVAAALKPAVIVGNSIRLVSAVESGDALG